VPVACGVVALNALAHDVTRLHACPAVTLVSSGSLLHTRLAGNACWFKRVGESSQLEEHDKVGQGAPGRKSAT